MEKVSISKTVVDGAQKGGKDYVLWDKTLSGFGLKVTPKGRKVYVLQYRMAGERSASRYTIGPHGKWTAEQARIEAKRAVSLIAMGKHPLADKAAALQRTKDDKAAMMHKANLENELAFSRLADAWLDHYENEKKRRTSSVNMAKLVVKNHLKPVLGSTPAPHITRADMQLIIDAIPTKQRAMRRNVFAYSSVLFGWMRRRGHIERNPIEFIDKPEAPASRDRVLSDVELKVIWNASYSIAQPFGPFIRLLVLTIQRRGEVAAINWTELDRKSAVWTIPADRAKNGVAHIVHLSKPAIAELDALAGGTEWPKAGYVLTTTGRTPISGISKAKRALDLKVAEEMEMPSWRLHDLRRTGATRLQKQGVRFEVTEAVLNHVSGAKSGVAGVYQRHDWKDEKRIALNAYSAGLLKLVAKK